MGSCGFFRLYRALWLPEPMFFYTPLVLDDNGVRSPAGKADRRARNQGDEGGCGNAGWVQEGMRGALGPWASNSDSAGKGGVMSHGGEGRFQSSR